MKNNRQIKNERCEHHSNLALVTTVVAMIGFVSLMFVYIGEHNSANALAIITASCYLGIAYWVAAALTAYRAVKKAHKYLVEYVVFLLVFGFGFFFMHNMPEFVYNIIAGTALAGNWARSVFKALAILLAAYFVVSVGWHVILATPGRGKK